jgi:hypothetical protein
MGQLYIAIIVKKKNVCNKNSISRKRKWSNWLKAGPVHRWYTAALIHIHVYQVYTLPDNIITETF